MSKTDSADANRTVTCPICYGEAINVQGVSDCRHCEWTGRRE